MSFTRDEIATLAANSNLRRSACFGAPDTNGRPQVSKEERLENTEFADRLVDELRAKPLQS
jgi:hypothetical protein